MLANLQELLYPLCGFLNQLQKDTARLYEVLHCFGYIMKIFECQEDFEFGTRMKACIESFANLSWTHIGQWLKYYYEAWFNCKSMSILAELIKYKRKIDPYDSESFKQFKGNLNICGLLWGYYILIAEPGCRLHVAAPILLGDENVEQELVITDLDYQVSDDNDVEEVTAIRSHNQKNRSLEENEDLVAEEEQRWENLINEWIEVGERENKFKNKDDEILLLSEWDADFSLGG
ncbi:7387_t:CDS:2 [Cetraspora pellucida]|uniref:7387_t:CDS:1 n=1 Tax=Cetraspora pellucida TaxID=1433469 RepID=A0A9N9JWC9_9GLOM|nr:7387_t:CDS:2 [Cetraspora pellucida]